MTTKKGRAAAIAEWGSPIANEDEKTKLLRETVQRIIILLCADIDRLEEELVQARKPKP